MLGILVKAQIPNMSLKCLSTFHLCNVVQCAVMLSDTYINGTHRNRVSLLNVENQVLYESNFI